MLVRFQETFLSVNFEGNLLKGILDDDCIGWGRGWKQNSCQMKRH